MDYNILKSIVLLLLGLYIFIVRLEFSEAATAADYFVRSLPGLSDNNSNLFFWLMHNKHIADRPNMDGVFLENGPWRINSDQTLRLIDGSWNEYANVLYVDQPVGTGFSFTDSDGYLNNLTQVYLAGESFAGTYIPYIAKAILDRNHARKTPDYHKYNAYYTYAVDQNIMDEKTKAAAYEQLGICMKDLQESLAIHVYSCEKVLVTISREGTRETCINQYDIRDHNDSYPSCGMNWPYELPTIYKYLRRPDVVDAIHANTNKLKWAECNSKVGIGFDQDMSPPSVTLMPDLLKQINVLLYNGDKDLICNIYGTQDMVKKLEWNGYKGFKDAVSKPWYINDKVVGEMTTERNLTYIVVYNTSHMVPYDAPVETMDMIYRFIGIRDDIIANFTSSIGIKDQGDYDNEEDSDNKNNEHNQDSDEQRQSKSLANQKMVLDLENNELDDLAKEATLFQTDDIDHFGDIKIICLFNLF
nr:10771_t:CDS:10 [Entrophospora candida]CAG8536382.1 346_t:CDS:10 [Entrophospora candida]